MVIRGIPVRVRLVSIFKNKIAVVTGGGSGIGRALARNLASQGADVVLADVQHDAAMTVAEGICESGGKASAHSLDVTDCGAVESFVGRIADEEGRLDYMFNNAGIAVLGEFRYLPSADWKRILDVNVSGVFAGTAAAYAVMIRQGNGHIVNTASVAGLVPALGLVAYCASKHAVVGLSTSLRAEAAVHGVNVSVVCPGFIKTPMLESKTVGTPTDEKTTARILKLAITPEECAAKALQGVANNKAVIPVTAHARAMWAIQRCFPSLMYAYSRRMAEKMHQGQGSEASI
jgi:NAD(P)-dependent dehydrogenase (short-subunit alcohol dehydrogenase family)